MQNLQSDSQKKLRSVIDRIETLQEQQKELGGDIKDILLEAKSIGLDPKIIRKVLNLRKKSKQDREAEEAILATYMACFEDTPLGSYANKQLETV